MTSILPMAATEKAWQKIEQERLCAQFGKIFGDRKRYATISIGDDSESLKKISDVFERPGHMSVVAFAYRWQAVPDPHSSDATKLLAEWMDLYNMVIPPSLRAPAEATLRLSLATKRTAMHELLCEAIHQNVGGLETKYIPLFEVEDGSLRTLCVLQLQ